MHTPESVEVLRAHGIDFQRHEDMGIDPNHFAELMITSGLVLTDETKWISFHRCAVYHSSRNDPKLTRAGGPHLSVATTLDTSSNCSPPFHCPQMKTRFLIYCVSGSRPYMTSSS